MARASSKLAKVNERYAYPEGSAQGWEDEMKFYNVKP